MRHEKSLFHHNCQLPQYQNICAGIRWLFRKRETAKARLKHDPSWEDVLMEYKGKLKSNSLESKNIRKKIKRLLGELNDK